MNRFRTLVVMVLVISVSFLIPLQAQVPETYSSADIFLQIKKLKVLASVLYVAAHPDDENNGFLPYLAKEKLYRTGYLSLTRGDGGQNLIGSEQGIELGLIRTRELLAARRIDGAEQYFSRAYEFGFSKSADEALHIWDRKKVLSDVVWMIRKFQPDVIITRFPGDARAGHGHHAASSVLAQEAYTAAADPTQFPEQFAHGVKPWHAKRILWNTFNFGGNNTTSENQFKLEVGGYNPLLGKSYGELGGEARTMHKSQGEGRPRRRGEVYEYFQTLGGEAPEKDLMDGIETDWKRIPGGAKIEERIDWLLKDFQFEHPEHSVPELVNLYKAIQSLPVSNWRDQKLSETRNLIISCAALFCEATTSLQNVTQGSSLPVNFFVNARNQVTATLKHIHSGNFDSSLSVELLQNKNISINQSLAVAQNKPLSQPYWLVHPQEVGIFDVRDQELIGKAQNDPAFDVTYTISIDGEDFKIDRPVQYKVVDPAKGELYEPVAVIPQKEINFTSENFVSLNGASVRVPVQLKANNGKEGKEVVRVSDPHLFKNLTGSQSLTLEPGQQPAFVFAPLSAANSYKEEISLTPESGAVFGGSTRVIAYDHIPTITYFTPAKANLIHLSVVTKGKKVGYIAGAGDKVPDALEQLGYEVTLLSESDLTAANLKQFDAIVTGIRASNIYEYLTEKNEVLNEYVKNGGNLIAQYIKSNNVGSQRLHLGPYPFTISTGSRVTEENAAVHFALPDHPVLNYPNKISEQDFEGWVQERSTYQVMQSDPHFEMPLVMHDSGEKDSNGSLAIAKYGKGNFAYVSLVLFRQLPAGIPGAFRILVNLLALPKNP